MTGARYGEERRECALHLFR